MRLATLKIDQREEAAIKISTGYILVSEVNQRLNKEWATDILAIIQSGDLEGMNAWYREEGKTILEGIAGCIIVKSQAKFGPLYRHPSKIWGIGLNYMEHAGDLSEKPPTHSPASFAEFDTTVIGPGEEIRIPAQSEKTTAGAELGIIFGKKCKDVDDKNWLDVVAGFTTLIDVTAEDILSLNPHYLTGAKNFDAFFSFGPELVTPDEMKDDMQLKIATVLNGKIYAQNIISYMTFPPRYLVSFHTKLATMFPGDIICTGTPRAVHILHGDVVECRIDGFEALKNPVIDLKVQE